MFKTVLIANRGEIARRVLRTCREMGLHSLAVYSDADREMPLVTEADLAVRLGPPPVVESYLNQQRLLAVAAEHGAEAIHPGYGFLAENAAFAEACREAGLVFIGPSPEAIRAMGDKAGAKRLMAAAGVPVLPGYDGEDQGDAALATEAENVGFPLLVKAVAGGGGRGIRLAREAGEMGKALESARREATVGFGDGRLMLEKFLENPRHVEFQIVADGQGGVVHLWERECSLQRRHQKIIEETPSPAMTPALRTAMGEAAVRAARAIHYAGAGTVEFLLAADGNFYFLEMNTRLQVEHPITEMVTGLDLVRMQIEVAQGRPLAVSQQEIQPRGHAIECRLNAENPAKRFLPAVGRLEAFTFPTAPGLRVETGYAAGCEKGPHYDSLLAKLIVHAPTREEARCKMATMLAGAVVAGPATTLPFLQVLIAHPRFATGQYHTAFVEENLADLVAQLPGA